MNFLLLQTNEHKNLPRSKYTTLLSTGLPPTPIRGFYPSIARDLRAPGEAGDGEQVSEQGLEGGPAMSALPRGGLGLATPPPPGLASLLLHLFCLELACVLRGSVHAWRPVPAVFQ